MSQTPDPVWDRLVELSACLCTAVAEEDGLSPLCFCGPVAGAAISYEYVGNTGCLDGGSDGMGWVRLGGAYMTENFPTPINTRSSCERGYLALTGEIGIIRTMPITGDGEPADQEAELAATSRQVTEMLVIRKALVCCYKAEIVLGTYVPVGPQGMAIGGYWTFTASTDIDPDDED